MNIDLRDVCAGVLVAAIGLFFFIGAFRYGIGDAREMGPGYFPMILGAGTTLMGVVIMVPALWRQGQVRLSFGALRPLAAVLLAVAAFGIGLRWLGLVPAIFATVLISALGHRPYRLAPTALLAVCTAVAAWLLFVVGLGLPMVAFRGL